MSLALVKGWWDFLNNQGLLDGFNDVLGSVENALATIHDSVAGDARSFVMDLGGPGSSAIRREQSLARVARPFQQMGIEEAWIWIAARTQLVREIATGLVGETATDIVSTLKKWNYYALELNVEVPEIRQSIARVVSLEFENANSAANAMRRDISEYRRSANLTGVNLPLAVS